MVLPVLIQIFCQVIAILAMVKINNDDREKPMNVGRFVRNLFTVAVGS